MVEIQVVYQGGLHTQATHGPSKATLETDAPVDNHGRGQSFSPTDLLATSLGTCMLTVMGIVADRHQWDMTGAHARVEKHMSADLPRRVVKLVVEIAMPRSYDQTARETLERTGRNCPVFLSLHPDIVKDISFTYPSH